MKLTGTNLTSGVFIVMIFTFLMSSCNLTDNFDEYYQEEKQMIQNFLEKNDTIDFTLKTTGLYYAELKEGTGPRVDLYDTLSVVYTAKFLNGTIFDTCVGIDTVQYVINEYYSVPGFHEGLLYMKEGGKSLFLIPSGLAFGPSGANYTGYQGEVNIPGFTPILFEVDLVKVAEYSPGE